LKTYEGMFIFLPTMEEEVLEKNLEKIRAKITGLEGKVESTTRMGRNTFVGLLKKQKAGQYALIRFSVDPGKTGNLREQLKADENIFRYQIVLAPKVNNTKAKAPADKKTGI